MSGPTHLLNILVLMCNYFRHNEHVLELYFLQSNGNMMEYPTWRKKLPTPQFQSFKRNHRLDLASLDDGDLMQTVRKICLIRGLLSSMTFRSS